MWANRWRIAIVAAAIGATLFIVLIPNELGGVSVPRPDRVLAQNETVINANQHWPWGWKPGEAQWFHHANQGTRILPYDWFVNLEQPTLVPLGKFVEGGYLQRFGFLPSEPHDTFNPGGLLPIGFAIDWDYDAPYANPPYKGPVVGLTCAACHTGKLTFRDASGALRGVRIEGGSAMINLSAFQEAIGRALKFTLDLGGRFDRFAEGVLKEGAKDPNRKNALRQELSRFLETGLRSREYARVHKLNGTVGGFGRTDALGLIGNRVFGVLGNENLSVPDAPVNFPPLWDTSWFTWVQYNASIRMPMVRNIGEALGVGAAVNLNDPRYPRYASTVNVENLSLMENQLGGPEAFSGLRAPRWEDTGLPPLERARVARGEALYRANCQGCHRAPLNELLDSQGRPRPNPRIWETDPVSEKRFLKVVMCDLEEIGTDPNQARNLHNRVATFLGKRLPAARGLYAVTEFIRRDKYEQLGLDETGIASHDRFRTFSAAQANREEIESGQGIDEVLVADTRYKARPLDGIWATPPFLHNGSVPNLHQLLMPVARRDKVFFLGTTRFDPVEVGYETYEFSGAFRLDTTVTGNSNAGHEFRNLTLEEFESHVSFPNGRTPQPTDLLRDRWAFVLNIPRDEMARKRDDELWTLIRDKTRETLRAERDHPFPGVIGAELTGGGAARPDRVPQVARPGSGWRHSGGAGGSSRKGLPLRGLGSPRASSCRWRRSPISQ